jgi:hypothetical protein
MLGFFVCANSQSLRKWLDFYIFQFSSNAILNDRAANEPSCGVIAFLGSKK